MEKYNRFDATSINFGNSKAGGEAGAVPIRRESTRAALAVGCIYQSNITPRLKSVKSNNYRFGHSVSVRSEKGVTL
jgi:hypothetical protein